MAKCERFEGMAVTVARISRGEPPTVRQEMSKTRQRALAARGYSVTHPAGAAVLPIEAGWDQLLYAASGVMTITTATGAWVIPPQRALWVPDGARATVHTRTRVAVRTLYLSSTLRAMPTGTRAVNVSPLVRELLLHAVR